MKKLILGIIGVFILITSYGQNYNEEWSYGSEITIEATPNPGWEFVNWTDEITGEFISDQNPYSFTVTGEVNYLGNFQKIVLQLVLNNSPESGGNTFGAGNYDWGDEVTIIAEPNDGFTFLYWLNNITNEQIIEQEYVFIIDENNTSFTAYYELQLYWVNVIINPEGAGMVTGGGTYFGGDKVELYSESNMNWVFENWVNIKTGEIVEDNPYIFRIYDDYDFIANFTAELNSGDISSNEIRVYPNPTNNELFIETPENSKIKIITLNGRRILINEDLSKTLHQINVSTLAPSVYLIEVEIDGIVSYYKFIVQ